MDNLNLIKLRKAIEEAQEYNACYCSEHPDFIPEPDSDMFVLAKAVLELYEMIKPKD